MGIYDPVLQAYQHGVDQRIQLASQPMTLAQSILGGYQQGFGNRMQRERMDLERQQLEEAKRKAMAAEEEARRWHQGQEQDRVMKLLPGMEATSNEELEAIRARLSGAKLPTEFLPKQLQQDPGNLEDQRQFDTNQSAANESPFDLAGPGGSSFQAERPADKLKPWRGAALNQKYAETERKQDAQDWRKEYQGRQLDQKDIEELRKARVDDNRIQQIQEAIRMGRSLEPFTQELKAAQAWRARNYLPESTGFGAGGQMNTKTMAEIMRRAQQIKAASDKEAQSFNDSLEGIRASQKGQPPKSGLSEDEALAKALEQVKTVSEAGSTPGSGFTVSGGGVSLVPTKPGAAPAPRQSAVDKIRMKARTSTKSLVGQDTRQPDGIYQLGDKKYRVEGGKIKEEVK